jgi:hypothetical protein
MPPRSSQKTKCQCDWQINTDQAKCRLAREKLADFLRAEECRISKFPMSPETTPVGAAEERRRLSHQAGIPRRLRIGERPHG